MKVWFSDDGRDDYLHWAKDRADTFVRLHELIADICRNPFTGLGKPEPLKGDLSGWWSRRITGERRLIYRAQGSKGINQRIEIIQCRYHY